MTHAAGPWPLSPGLWALVLLLGLILVIVAWLLAVNDDRRLSRWWRMRRARRQVHRFPGDNPSYDDIA